MSLSQSVAHELVCLREGGRAQRPGKALRYGFSGCPAMILGRYLGRLSDYSSVVKGSSSLGDRSNYNIQ